MATFEGHTNETWFIEDDIDFPRLSAFEVTSIGFILDAEFQDTLDIVEDLEFDPTNVRRFAYSTAGGQIIVRFKDAGTWTLVQNFSANTGVVRDIAWSPDGEELAAAENDGNVSFWDTTTWENIRNISDSSAIATAVSYSANGDWFVYGGFSDDNVYRYNTSDFTQTFFPLTHYNGSINALAFSSENQWLAVAPSNDDVYLQEQGGGFSTDWILTAGDDSLGVGWNVFDEFLGLANNDGNVYFYNTDDPADVFLDTDKTRTALADFVEYAPSDALVAFNDFNEIDFVTIDANNNFAGTNTIVSSLNRTRTASFSADSDLFAHGDDEGRVFVYSVAEGPSQDTLIPDQSMGLSSTINVTLTDFFNNFNNATLEIEETDGTAICEINVGQTCLTLNFDVTLHDDFNITITSKETAKDFQIDVFVSNDFGTVFDSFDVSIEELQKIKDLPDIDLLFNERRDIDLNGYYAGLGDDTFIVVEFTNGTGIQILEAGDGRDFDNFAVNLTDDLKIIVESKSTSDEFQIRVVPCADSCSIFLDHDTFVVTIADLPDGYIKEGRDAFNDMFGFADGSITGLNIFAAFISMAMAVVTAVWSKKMFAGVFTGIGFLGLFTALNWFPLWITAGISIVGLFVIWRMFGGINEQ